MIRFSALGVSEVRLPDGSPVPGLASKRLALLAYLVLARPRGFHRRDTLLGLLWPESTQEKARNALRQALHQLRAALGEGVVLTRGAAEVAVDAGALRCDAIAFEEELRAGRTAEALALYHGDLLPGLFVADAPGFEDWLSRERGRLRELAAAAGWSLVATTADPVARAAWVRWSIALSPLDELATRRGMEALR
ncbi:MAG TPA: hypothetical protein VEW03_04480, partial [Longimicrobiaceae bacterium]|nr:hypothetical protein [Longimicrobiaceae bacterium]